ncbi:translesion DNA synthesis-associated protein ImuA [Colwelliaceae bacterium 6471]
MDKIIERLQNQRLLWRGTERKMAIEVTTSGYPELDHKLQGGLPQSGVVEINTPIGIGEIRLLIPYIKQAINTRLLVFIAPPGIINAEHFFAQGLNVNQIITIHPNSHQEGLWAAEQCLKSGACHALLHWHQALEVHHIKRFQIAAETGNCLHFLFKEKSQYSLSLPVSLSMKLSPHHAGISIDIPKRKGGWPISNFTVDMSTHWPALTRAKTANSVVAFPSIRTR